MQAKDMIDADPVPNSEIPNACLAPPLTDEKIKQYEAVIESLPAYRAEVRDAMAKCLACVKVWWELPVSTKKAVKYQLKHKGKDLVFELRPLEDQHIEKLWDTTPWLRECKSMQELFDGIDDGMERELRDAAHHLLWFATELSLYREPVTSDMLK